ncbi:hypothetical protein [Acholeplasma hippikon]|nr:hypothetical protein [Acholeplasma hippikon]
MKLKSMLTFIVTILISFILAITTYVIFNPIKVEKQNQITLEKIREVIPMAKTFELNKATTVNGTEISLSGRVKDVSGKELGYVYEMNEKNGFGNIKILVAADVKGIITKTVIVELNQTMYVAQSEKLIAAYVNQNLSKITDLNAGATSVSHNTIMGMFRNLGEHHKVVPQFDNKPAYFDFFGEDYVIKSTDTKVIDGAEVKVEVIKDKGYVYSLNKKSIYNSDSSTEKAITLVIAMDNDGKILGALLPVETYEHTMGYRTLALTYANSFKDTNIADFVDAYAGVSADDGEPNNTKWLIHRLYVIAKEVYLA